MRQHYSAAYAKLSGDVLYDLRQCLRGGIVAVILGESSTGKSFLASKALPGAAIMSAIDDSCAHFGEMDSDLIGDHLYAYGQRIQPDAFIRCRNQALALGHQVIIVGQMWHDVHPYLSGLDVSRYRVFDLSHIWASFGHESHVKIGIPSFASVYP